MQMMQMSANMMNLQNAAGGSDGAPGADSGFKLGNISIPPALIGKLMQMEMSPENLEKLQSVLDFVFEMIPSKQEEQDEQ